MSASTALATPPPAGICDSIKACVGIPVFNHARTVGDVVSRARAICPTVLVCDDGSTDGSGAAAKEAGAELLVHPRNYGKGHALKTLLHEAQRRGFRYLIALDADGQHYPEDIPSMVAAVNETPGALVVGARDLEKAGAPPSSQFGRKFSNFWVWFEAGEKVDDSQSGFRAYPLPETIDIAGQGGRYDFEVKVLLKAAWSGIPLRSSPIQVLYPKDRVTHFRPFKDNFRISLLNLWTCIRLFLPLPLAPLMHQRPRLPGVSLDAIRRWFWLGGPGLLPRVLAAASAWLPPWLGVPSSAALGFGAYPALLAGWLRGYLDAKGFPLWQVTAAVLLIATGFGGLEAWIRRRTVQIAELHSNRAWSGKSRGGALGHAILIWLIRLFGTWPVYLLVYPVTLYFFVTASKERQMSAEYLDRAIGPASGLSRALRTYRHLLAFARSIVDRLILGILGSAAFARVAEENVDAIVEASKSPKGSILVTAHFGSWEIASGGLHGRLQAPFDIVAFQGEYTAIREVVAKSSAQWKPNILFVGRGELAALEILRALRSGHMVALQGDRQMDGRVAQAMFLGQVADFPVGPFMLAAISGAPLIATFNYQQGPGRYAFKAFPAQTYQFDRKRSRDEQIAEWVQDYATKLETLVKQYPFQWFNFYDFWAPHK